MESVRVPISSLRPGHGSRPISEGRVTELMNKPYVLLEPLVVLRGADKVLDGNHRLEALKRLGHEYVMVYYVDEDTTVTLDVGEFR